MAIRADKVQIEIEFITDASKAFARTLQETEKYRNELRVAQKEVANLAKEEERLAAKGKDTTQVALKRAEAEKRVQEALQNIVNTSQKLQGIDLKDLLPEQLQQRAAQLKQSLKFIPESHPARAQMQADFDAISDKLRELNGRAKTVDGSLNQMRTSTSGLGGFFQNAFSVFLGGGLIGAVMAVVGGIFSIGKSAVKAGADMESLTVTLEVLMGSAAQAKKFLKDIQDFAAATPFEFPQLAEAGKKLVAFGYSGDEAMVMLRRLGDVSAAAQVPIEELAGIVGKAKLGQLIQGEELNQLADRGINVFGELATVLGTTESKIKKLGSEGKISYVDLEKAIVLATDKGGQFFGLMDKQSQTFTGLMSTLSDNFGQFTQAIFGGVGNSLKPIIAGISGFFGQLTLLIREGKEPVGEYADVIKTAGRTVSFLGTIFVVVWESAKLLFGLFAEGIKITSFLGSRVADAAGWLVQMAQKAKDIPILGTLFRPLLNAIGLVSDLLSNASATFAGFRAAASQAVTNVQNYFRALVIDAQILGAKIQSALSFDKAAKENAARYIQQLESQKSAIFQGGKSVEQAYIDGRNAAIAVGQKAEAEAEVKRKAKQQAKIESDAKAEEKAAKEKLDRLKSALELEIKDRQIYYRREELANEIAFKQKGKTESDFNKTQLELERDKYTALIKIYDTYQAAFGSKSEQFRNLEIQKLEAQGKILNANAELGQFAPRNTQVVETLETKKITSVQRSTTGSKLDDLRTQESIEDQFLKEKFARQVLSEMDFENEKARIRSEYATRALEIAMQNGETEKGQIEKLNAEKITADTEYQEKLRENEKRTVELKDELEKVKLQLASDAFDVGIDLLSSDEEARKKNAGAIKAFQVGKVVADGIQEVQAIWLAANSNPLNYLIPGSGAVIAGVQTALAVGRSAAAIGKITAQKFAGGGFTGEGIKLRDDTGFKVAGVVHEGEYVVPKWIVDNPKYQPTIAALEQSRVKGFALGGFVDTTPRIATFSNTPSVPNNTFLESIKEELKTYTQKVDNWANNLTVKLSLFDLEKAQYQKSVDLKDAQY